MLFFVRTNYGFSESDHGDAETEGKRHDLAEEKLQKVESKTEAKDHINNVDQALLEYHRVLVKQMRLLPLEHQLSDFLPSIKRIKK